MEGFEPGDSVGLCFDQQGGPEEQAATCWTFTMRTDGEFKDSAESYLVMPSEINNSTRLSDFTNKSSETTPGLFGSWMCLPVAQYWGEAHTSCLRLLPRSDSTTQDDPSLDIGPVRVMTYMTNRQKSTEEASEDSAFNENETFEPEESLFEIIQVNLMGAREGLAIAAFAIATTVSLLSF